MGAVPQWIADWAPVAQAPALTLRLEDDTILLPCGVVLLASGIASRRESKRSTTIELANRESDAARYLSRIDFFEKLGLAGAPLAGRGDPAGRFVSLRPILDLQGARELADATGAFLEAQLAQASPSVLRGVRFVFEELGANIVQHSGRPDTGFGAAQAFPTRDRGRFQLAFADAGVGFLRSLLRNPEFQGRVTEESDAVQLAVERGLSGVVGRSNMGIGLSWLRDLSDRLGGELWVLSGASLWHRRTVAGSRASTVAPIARWEGSMVCLDAPVFPI